MKLMKSTRSFLWLAVALCMAGSSALAKAPKCGGDYHDEGGGSWEVPGPFLSSNRHVELADNELYTLVGYVRFDQDQPYFEVDLDEHPWLATKTKKDNPYYLLESSSRYWRRWENRRMRIYVEAHGNIESPRNGTPFYYISLQALADPTDLGKKDRGGSVSDESDSGRKGGGKKKR